MSLSKLNNNLFIIKPPGAGATQVEEYYIYNTAQPGELNQIPLEIVPKNIGVDDSGIEYEIPVQNGWLIEFNSMRMRTEKWILFCSEDKLFIDTFAKIYEIGDGACKIKIGRFFILVTIQILFENKCINAIHAWFPWYRGFFIQNSSEYDECSPFYWILKELASSDGRATWMDRWSSGFAVRNESIRMKSSIENNGHK